MPKRVYPRVCGGTAVKPDDEGYRTGLSPRVRGNPNDYLPQSVKVRSIPACAGEPAPASYWRECGKVYPRVCGGTSLM